MNNRPDTVLSMYRIRYVSRSPNQGERDFFYLQKQRQFIVIKLLSV